MDYSKYDLTKDLMKQINKEVALINQDYSLNSPGCLRDEIFELLEKVGSLIFYPINERDLWGIYVCKNEKHYFVINSSIELEKQIFAAAHEMAHSLDIAKVNFEMVTADLMTEYVNHKNYGDQIAKADLIANRFAAEILVGHKKLIEKYNEMPDYYTLQVKAVLLSDIFLVPYKTIIKRFVETGLITEHATTDQLLRVEDKQIKSIAERYECCRRNYEITNEKRLGRYIDKALMLYENELSTYGDLEKKLELLNKTPEDYGIQDTSFDLYEMLRRASESSEVEDQDDDEE